MKYTEHAKVTFCAFRGLRIKFFVEVSKGEAGKLRLIVFFDAWRTQIFSFYNSFSDKDGRCLPSNSSTRVRSYILI